MESAQDVHGCPVRGNSGLWKWARDVPEYERVHKMCTNHPLATRFDGYDKVGFGPVFLLRTIPAPVLWQCCFLYQYYPIPISNKDKSPTIESVVLVVSGLVLMCLKDWTSIILDEMPKLNSWTCFLMYIFRKAGLDQHPISMMIEKTGTRAAKLIVNTLWTLLAYIHAM